MSFRKLFCSVLCACHKNYSAQYTNTSHLFNVAMVVKSLLIACFQNVCFFLSRKDSTITFPNCKLEHKKRFSNFLHMKWKCYCAEQTQQECCVFNCYFSAKIWSAQCHCAMAVLFQFQICVCVFSGRRYCSFWVHCCWICYICIYVRTTTVETNGQNEMEEWGKL